jgi:hypothetical protein
MGSVINASHFAALSKFESSHLASNAESTLNLSLATSVILVDLSSSTGQKALICKTLMN